MFYLKNLSDGTCGNEWICEHRWKPIVNMVQFRNEVGNETIENWWDNGYHQIAYSRGNKGILKNLKHLK